MTLKYSAIVATISALAATACETESRELMTTEPENVNATEYVFAEQFEVVAEIPLEQNDVSLVAGLSDLKFLGGEFYVVDPSEGDVKVYSLSGNLIRVVGRKGAGPGEFRQPLKVDRFSDGRLAVFDQGLSRVEMFDASGNSIRSIRLEHLGTVSDFAVWSDTAFVFAAFSPERSEVLTLTDTLGAVQRVLLPIANRVPDGEAPGYVWDYPRAVFLRLAGDAALVASSLRPEIWRVDLRSGSITGTAISFPDYDPPVLPRNLNDYTGRELMEWFHSRHLLGFVHSTRDGLPAAVFVKGDRTRSSSAILVTAAGNGRWDYFTDAPQIVHIQDSILVGVEDVAGEDMKVVLYVRRTSSERAERRAHARVRSYKTPVSWLHHFRRAMGPARSNHHGARVRVSGVAIRAQHSLSRHHHGGLLASAG